MATYTPLPLEDATRLARAHGLGGASAVIGIPAGSVNSNYRVETTSRPVFVRIYEEQDVDGVAYEWALLAHLAAKGLPVPRRVEGPPSGEQRVAGKPTAIFEIANGEEICQRMVDVERARAVGALLARTHEAGRGFEVRVGRFGLPDVRARLRGIAALDRPELREAVQLLRVTLDEVEAAWDPSWPGGVIHGDLFRDNVRWDGATIACALDWESASDGRFVYDVAVAALAWCFGDAMRWDLVAAMREGYEAIRPWTDAERVGWRTALRAAAARFTVTRITDYHLRPADGQIKKDWRRFLARLEQVSAAP